jgi:lipid-A-disaccharide synthase
LSVSLRIGIVANEVSGDLLGAGLIREIRKRYPDAQFEGVGGPEMIEQGCGSLFPMERLSVMGLVEVLKHLPELLFLRRSLLNHFRTNPPDLFIGIDAPDFNLGLERRFKQSGIPTVHYVCPSIWAWRPKRVKKIRKAVNLILSILPFEKPLLEKAGVSTAYVGHPMADEIPLEVDTAAARKALKLEGEDPLIALLPGSRRGEVQALSETFLQAAHLCREQIPDARFVVPLVNPTVRELFEQELARSAPDLPITLVDGRSREVMQAADAVLVASGTATLEAMLLKKPMVVAYRVHWFTHWLLIDCGMLKIPHVALANLVAGEEIAPEYIQHAATPEALSGALISLLNAPQRMAQIQERSAELHRTLRLDASRSAAEAVLGLIGKR